MPKKRKGLQGGDAFDQDAERSYEAQALCFRRKKKLEPEEPVIIREIARCPGLLAIVKEIAEEEGLSVPDVFRVGLKWWGGKYADMNLKINRYILTLSEQK